MDATVYRGEHRHGRGRASLELDDCALAPQSVRLADAKSVAGRIRLWLRPRRLPASLDWAWTTPLTALMLFSIAQAPAGVTRRQVALSLVGCGLMVGAGALATDRALDATWVWFALSCLGMLAVTGGLVRAMRPGVPTLYAPLLGLTVVTWSLFPLVWLLDAARLDRFLILNLFAKLSLFTLVLILTWREVVSDWRMKS